MQKVWWPFVFHGHPESLSSSVYFGNFTHDMFEVFEAKASEIPISPYSRHVFVYIYHFFHECLRVTYKPCGISPLNY